MATTPVHARPASHCRVRTGSIRDILRCASRTTVVQVYPGMCANDVKRNHVVHRLVPRYRQSFTMGGIFSCTWEIFRPFNSEFDSWDKPCGPHQTRQCVEVFEDATRCDKLSGVVLQSRFILGVTRHTFVIVGKISFPHSGRRTYPLTRRALSPSITVRCSPHSSQGTHRRCVMSSRRSFLNSAGFY